jgi:hypothetical protein
MKIIVCIESEYFTGGACINIADVIEKHFKPIKICDDPIYRSIIGEISSSEANVIMSLRKDAVEVISKELANMIVNEMKKNDTVNGYELNI